MKQTFVFTHTASPGDVWARDLSVTSVLYYNQLKPIDYDGEKIFI